MVVSIPKMYMQRWLSAFRKYFQRSMSAFRDYIQRRLSTFESISNEARRLSENISNEGFFGFPSIYATRCVCVCVFNFGLEDRDLKPKTSKWRSSTSIVNIRQRLALTREIFRTMKYGKRESYIFVSGSR